MFGLNWIILSPHDDVFTHPTCLDQNQNQMVQPFSERFLFLEQLEAKTQTSFEPLWSRKKRRTGLGSVGSDGSVCVNRVSVGRQTCSHGSDGSVDSSSETLIVAGWVTVVGASVTHRAQLSCGTNRTGPVPKRLEIYQKTSPTKTTFIYSLKHLVSFSLWSYSITLVKYWTALNPVPNT